MSTTRRSHLCLVHDKKCYATRKQAKRAIRAMHDSGMREYRCEANRAFWHVGHLPLAVRRGAATRGEHYGHAVVGNGGRPVSATANIPPAGVPAALMFKPSPLDIKPLPPRKAVEGPAEPVADNTVAAPAVPADAPAGAVQGGIEGLLAAAEGCDVVALRDLAGQIRELVERLAQELRVSRQERELLVAIRSLTEQRDKKVQDLKELRLASAVAVRQREPVPEVEQGQLRVPQAAIRAWARSRRMKVKPVGSLPAAVIEAYERAMAEVTP